MSGWLVDTNVLSAFAPGKTALPAIVADWFRARTDALFLSTVTVAEIESGIAKLRRSGNASRAAELDRWFEQILDLYAERVLPFDLPAARIAGALNDAAQASGRHPGFPDIAIASIARSRNLVVVTRNRRHFSPLGSATVDPFAQPAPI